MSRFDISLLESAPKVPAKPRHKTREVRVGDKVFGGQNPDDKPLSSKCQGNMRMDNSSDILEPTFPGWPLGMAGLVHSHGIHSHY